MPQNSRQFFKSSPLCGLKSSSAPFLFMRSRSILVTRMSLRTKKETMQMQLLLCLFKLVPSASCNRCCPEVNLRCVHFCTCAEWSADVWKKFKSPPLPSRTAEPRFNPLRNDDAADQTAVLSADSSPLFATHYDMVETHRA